MNPIHQPWWEDRKPRRRQPELVEQGVYYLPADASSKRRGNSSAFQAPRFSMDTFRSHDPLISPGGTSKSVESFGSQVNPISKDSFSVNIELVYAPFLTWIFIGFKSDVICSPKLFQASWKEDVSDPLQSERRTHPTLILVCLEQKIGPSIDQRNGKCGFAEHPYVLCQSER